MTLLNNQPRKGQKLSYKREIMFKGTETVISKIVGIFRNTIFLKNGDSFRYFISK